MKNTKSFKRLIVAASFFQMFIFSQAHARAQDLCGKTLAVIGDCGNGSREEGQVASLVKSWKPDAILTAGDNNYDTGSAKTIDPHIGQFYSQYIYPYKGRYTKPTEKVNRFFPSLGNHDWDDGPSAYFNYFTLPGNEHYYDIVQGPIHFFILNSCEGEDDGNDAGSKQALWLKESLKKSTAKFKVVLFHHPPYSSDSDHTPELVMRWPFKAWGATAVITGHNHFYERLVSGGLTYFVNGTGGQGLYPIKRVARESVVRVEDVFGAQRITTTCSEMKIEFVELGGRVRDSVIFK
jgi:tartrate-resistant acid phosphatase type 5